MYQSLRASRHEVRVIELRGGDFNDPMNCTLHVVSLDDAPSYEALSYVWGDESQRSFITVQGIQTSVTTSLKLVLQYLRRTHSSRVIWADAICINQADEPERSSQVRLMGEIYRGATGVVAWLGEAARTSDLAVDTVHCLGASETLHWKPEGPDSVDPRYLTNEAIASVLELMKRPWWQRVWIVQESILCPRFSFLCGTKELSSEAMFTVGKNYYTHSISCCNDHWSQLSNHLREGMNEHMDTLFVLGQARQIRDNLDLGGMIAFNRWRHCKDPRDRIYGFVGLEMSSYKGQIVPDYSKSTPEVFKKATQTLLRRQPGGFCLWSLILPPKPQERPLAGLPSWAVDWSAVGSRSEYKELDNRTACLDLYSAGGLPLQVPGYDKARGLTCNAVIIATISELGHPSDEEYPNIFDTITSWMTTFQKALDSTLRYPFATAQGSTRSNGDIAAEDAFWLTICSSALNMNNPAKRVRINTPDEHRELYDEWYALAYAQLNPIYDSYGERHVVEIDHSRSMNELKAFGQSIHTSTILRRFFLTDDKSGLMGLAPRNARVGDVVAVIKGAHVPFILRKSQDAKSAWHKLKGSGSKWNLVGDAYVQGIMDGEGLEMGRMKEIYLV